VGIIAVSTGILEDCTYGTAAKEISGRLLMILRQQGSNISEQDIVLKTGLSEY
jgi:hypothetical protein